MREQATRTIKTDTEHKGANLTDPVFLQELRTMMLKFAVLQLPDEQLAEDAVQEAFIDALKNSSSFGRRTAFKSWVFTLLKHKIKDTLRQRNQFAEGCYLTSNNLNGVNADRLFDIKGHWYVEEKPATWTQPIESIKNEQFWRIFEICLSDLPNNQARLFMMREFLELNSDEICETLGITANNMHVILYRARLRLRECLEKKWFLEGEKIG